MKGNIRSIYSTEYNLSLFELLKSYSTIIMTKDFQKMNIPNLPVFTAEDGIKTIREFFGKLIEWKKLDDLKTNTIKTFSAGCNLALHCNGKLSEMKVVGDNSPKVSKFIIKKTSLFYKILS